MDPRDLSSDLEGDLTAGLPDVGRERGLAPAGSLTSIQIRRRTPARSKPRQSKPQQSKPQQSKPQQSKPPQCKPLAPPALPPVYVEPAPKPEVMATPASPHPASDPGRRMQSFASMPVAPPTAPAAAPPTIEPPAAPPPIVAEDPPAPAPSAPAARAQLTNPGITRYARTGDAADTGESKAALAIPVTKPTAPEPPRAREVRAEAPAPAPQATRPEGIVSYWMRLRGRRRYPSKADLDQGRIIADWPNSILMRCRIGSTALEPEKVFSNPNQASADAPGDPSQAAMDLSPMMLQWLLGLAGEAAKDRRPMQDTEAFPSRNQSVQYGAFALPFSDNQAEIDHVLCHVYRLR